MAPCYNTVVGRWNNITDLGDSTSLLLLVEVSLYQTIYIDTNIKLKPFGYVDDYLINKTAWHITVYLCILVSISLHLANEKAQNFEHLFKQFSISYSFD